MQESAPLATQMTVAQARALVARLLPPGISDRPGWAADIYAAFAALQIPPSVDNFCAAIAVTEQETGVRVDPAVPGLARIARREIERQSERAGIPKLALLAALALPSSSGRSYSERLDAVRTERELSEIFDDFTDLVPLGKRFFADRNPVRTGGPMQVSVAFAQRHAAAKPYPYPVANTLRQEVFTRRGGIYFGIAHLLDYPVSYNDHLYRYADFNAGRYASRNAAFQNALTQASGIPLALDGDLILHGPNAGADPGATESAVRVLARRLELSNRQIRNDLERGDEFGFEKTKVYAGVFHLADKAAQGPVPRAIVPNIALESPKITRKLSTSWFARRVADRHKSCVARSG